MDASVNMKMSPSEHRLLVSAVEEAKEIAADTHTLGGPHRNPAREDATPAEKRAAREREYSLSQLLTKL